MDTVKQLAAACARGAMSRREFMGRAAALGVSAAVAGVMLSNAARAEGPKKGGTLKMGLAGGESTNTLDPAAALSQVPFHVTRAFGETLLDVNGDGSFNMRLAESFEASADARTWAFKIRKGVEFHNGKTLTAQDVLATLRRHTDENTKSGAFGVMKAISEISADGDNLIVKVEHGNADLPYLMSTYQLLIQPDGGFDDPASGIGTGPYKVVVNEPGVRHVFEKNENYWDDTRGHVDSVEMVVINDSTARMAALQSGQVHIVNKIEPKIAHFLTRAPGLEVKRAAGRGHYVFIMHCDTAPFDNKDLRLALKYAINREEMVEKILRGFGSAGNDSPVNESYPFFDDSLPQRSYDAAKAAEHYKASGHDGSPIELHVSDVAFPGALDAAQLFQQTANAAGIPLELKREPADGYWSEVWNKQPFSASYWGGRPTQDQMFSTAYLSTADWNDTRFKNDRFDALLFDARKELDPARRKEMYGEMARLVNEEGGLICPMFNEFLEGVRSEVQGWETDGQWEVMNGLAPHKCWLA